MVKMLRQVNLARSLRNAGLLYVEITFGQRRALCDYTMVELDQHAIDSEHFFRRRYGFTARDGERAQIVELQRRHRLCDWEIRLLKFSRCLRRGDAGVWELRPDRATLCLGYVSIALVFMTLFFQTALIVTSGAPAHKQLAGMLVEIALTGGATWYYYRVAVLPWRVLKDYRASEPSGKPDPSAMR